MDHAGELDKKLNEKSDLKPDQKSDKKNHEKLDERKLKILKAVVKNYLETGEPVGSRTISKFTDLNLSSATIRNEMADLEELGYIVQPHTSAGRIPSDKGYRLYVDTMMQDQERMERLFEEKMDMLLEKEDRLDNMLKQVAKVLAVNTDYATLVSAPSIHRNRIKFLQLSRMDQGHMLVVTVMEGNLIRNNIVETDQEIDDETVLKLNILLNTHLNGLAVEEISLGLITALKVEAGEYGELVAGAIDAVAESINIDDLKIYTSGKNNILKYPELAGDNDKARELLDTFEEGTGLNELMKSPGTGGRDEIQVYIGQETRVSSMQDCSVVTATYDLGDGMKGTVGIIGPKRMNYEKVVGVLKNMKEQLDQMYSQN